MRLNMRQSDKSKSGTLYANTVEEGQQNQDESLEQTSGYSQEFQNRNYIFELNSMVHEANLKLQKISIQFQNEIAHERLYNQKIQSQKAALLSQRQYLNNQIQKMVLIVEAQKNAKTQIQSAVKQLKCQLLNIYEALRIDDQASNEQVLKQINILRKDKIENSQTLDILKKQKDKIKNQQAQQALNIKNKLQSENKQIKMEYENYISNLKSSYEKKQTELEKQLKRYREKQVNYDIKIQNLIKKLSKHQQIEAENQTLRSISQNNQQQNTFIKQQNTLLKQKLQQLHTKLTRQQQEKQKIQLEYEKNKFELLLCNKKLLMHEQKLKNQQINHKKFQQSIAELKMKNKVAQNRIIELEDEINSGKRQLQVCEIYKSKYKRQKIKLKQYEERLNQFQKLADAYATQIQQMNHKFQNQEEKQNQLQNYIHQSQKRYEEQKEQNIKLRCTKQKLEELLAQKKIELEKQSKYVQQLKQLTKGQRYEFNQKDEWNATNSKIINHYQNIIKEESQYHSKIQIELIQLKESVIILTNNTQKQQQQIESLKINIKILQDENQKLKNQMKQQHHLSKEKIEMIRERYNEMQNIKQEIKSRKTKQNLNLIRSMSMEQNQLIQKQPIIRREKDNTSQLIAKKRNQQQIQFNEQYEKK